MLAARDGEIDTLAAREGVREPDAVRDALTVALTVAATERLLDAVGLVVGEAVGERLTLGETDVNGVELAATDGVIVSDAVTDGVGDGVAVLVLVTLGLTSGRAYTLAAPLPRVTTPRRPEILAPGASVPHVGSWLTGGIACDATSMRRDATDEKAAGHGVQTRHCCRPTGRLPTVVVAMVLPPVDTTLLGHSASEVTSADHAYA